MENCTNCEHPKVKHFGWWNEYIATPIQHEPHERSRRRAITLLREFVLRSVVLRRTKKERASDFAIPPKVVTIRKDKMDDLQDEFYKQLYTESCVQFNSYVEAGTLKNNYAHVFGLLMRLRQAVDHPFLVLYSPTAELPHGFRENYVAHCSVPLKIDDTTRDCREKAHIVTILKRIKRLSILHRLNLTDFKSSTKIDALIRFLQVFPYLYYLCKDCDCKVLDYGSPENCTSCEHAKAKHFGWWNEYIASTIQNEPSERFRQRAMTLLRELVHRSVLLTRTKKDRASRHYSSTKFCYCQ